MKQCRIAITEDCNLSCDYCCMKLPEIRNSFISVNNISQIDLLEYGSFVITGGEPLVEKEQTIKILEDINKVVSSPIYLSTNGLLLDTETLIELSSLIDGINISVHSRLFDEYHLNVLEINEWIPVRLHIQDTKCNNVLYQWSNKNDIPLKIWHLNNCTTVPEDRFILKEDKLCQ